MFKVKIKAYHNINHKSKQKLFMDLVKYTLIKLRSI